MLRGKTLKELIQSQEVQVQNRNNEINKLAEQLDQTKEKLQFYTDNLKTKESLITEYQAEIKEKDLNLTNLQTNQAQLSEIKEQIETELKRQLTLTQTKIADLENQLLNLAKQKLANKKEAQNLVNQLQNQWQEQQTEWETKQAQLVEEKARQQDYAAQVLAQTKAQHAEEVRSLKTRHRQEQTRTKEEAQQNLNEAKAVYDNYRHQKEQELQAKNLKITELQEWSAGQHNRILELENNLNLAETEKAQLQQEKQDILTRASESIREKEGVITNLQNQLQASQQDGQTKQALINTLNEDKVSLQGRVAELAQTLTRQRTVLERLLADREQELTQLEEESHA